MTKRLLFKGGIWLYPVAVSSGCFCVKMIPLISHILTVKAMSQRHLLLLSYPELFLTFMLRTEEKAAEAQREQRRRAWHSGLAILASVSTSPSPPHVAIPKWLIRSPPERALQRGPFLQLCEDCAWRDWMLPTAGGKKTETGEKKISEWQNMRAESVMKEEVFCHL